jgi:cyanate permease
VGYAVLMPLVLVWAGEHYVVDTLLGAGYAAIVVLALRLIGMRTRRADDAALPTVYA